MPDRKTDAAARPSGDPAGDDLDLWRHVTREARPLKGRPRPPAETPGARETGARKPEPKPTPRRTEKAATKPSLPPTPPLAAGAAVGVDKRSVDRLRRGQLPPEATLDLHGMTREAARGALQGFVARAQTAGKRCVLVITGKGTPRLAEQDGIFGPARGVIRREVPDWLNQAPLRGQVLAFVAAQPKHGGAGAFYLLLKKRRGD